MESVLNLAMLGAASVAAMAFGIFAAYGILRVGFALIRQQRRPVQVQVRREAPQVT